jgi:hypothetical protein
MPFAPAPGGGSSSTSVSGQVVRISGETIAGEVIARISGQTVVASVASNISGNVVYLVSGFNEVSASVTTDISGQTVVAEISGQLVLTSVSGQSVRISGQVVKISGETVSLPVTQELVARVSGQELVVLPAGLSGLTVLSKISGQAVRMSGETVSLPASTSVHVSGEAILISGQTVLVPFTSISGNVVNISGQTVNASVTTNISGQVVYLVSGQNNVQISGQTISALCTILTSPLTVQGTVGTSVSGNMVSISGQPVVASVTTNISGQIVYLASGSNEVLLRDAAGNAISTQAGTVDTVVGGTRGVITFNYMAGYDPVANLWPRLRVTASGQGISGVTNKLIVAFSGDSAQISGQLVAVSGSIGLNAGTIVTTSGDVARISGNVVRISGETIAVSGSVALNAGTIVTISGNVVNVSGAVANISGNVVTPRSATSVRSRALLPISNGSGGTVLLSGDVISATLRNIEVSGNPMYVGGIGTEAPFSGKGFFLQGGDGITLNVNNFNQVQVFNATATSGKLLSYIGVQY